MSKLDLKQLIREQQDELQRIVGVIRFLQALEQQSCEIHKPDDKEPAPQPQE